MQHERSLLGHSGAVLCVRYTANGAHCVSCGADRTVKLWNPDREAPSTGGLLIKTYAGGHSKEVACVAVSQDSARIASGGGDTVSVIWDVSTGQVVRKLEGHTGRVNGISFAAPHHALAITASYDKTAKLWDLRSQGTRALQTITDFRDSVTAVGLVGAHTIIASSVDGCVRQFDIRKGEVRADDFKVPVTSVCVSHDGLCAAASCLDNSVRLVELKTGAQLNSYASHAHVAYSLEACFSHDDAYVVSGSEDGRVVAWKLVEADVAFELGHAHKKATASLSWHPTLPKVLVASFDGSVSLWATKARR
ncbi:WD40-repeat-containing domain protein [Pelagophyceae sp. CCMP2097]|nr:WD40-repeat-containing domain protein [Pelagophyceae sp. CCMP2097]